VSVGVLAPLHEWDGFEAACAELQACSADVARFLDAEIAELDRWQTALQQVSAAGAAAAASPVPGPTPRGRLACHASDAADQSASANKRSAVADAGSELVARLEVLCNRLEEELDRAPILAVSNASDRADEHSYESAADERWEEAGAEQGEAASQSYRRRLRALAEQVLILERDRCGTAAELAAARLRARQLARELKRQKNAFSVERRRWRRKLSAIERALETLSAPNAATGTRRLNPAEHSAAQKAKALGTTSVGLTDELLIEAIMAKCEMSPESRAG